MEIAQRIDGMIMDTYIRVATDFNNHISRGAMTWIEDQAQIYSEISALEDEIFDLKEKVEIGRGSLGDVKDALDKYYDLYKKGLRRYKDGN